MILRISKVLVSVINLSPRLRLILLISPKITLDIMESLIQQLLNSAGQQLVGLPSLWNRADEIV